MVTFNYVLVMKFKFESAGFTFVVVTCFACGYNF